MPDAQASALPCAFVDTPSLLTASKGVQEIRLLVIPTMPAHENFADGRGRDGGATDPPAE